MREHDIVFVVFYAQAGCHEKGLPKHCGIRLHLQDSTVGTGRFPRPQNQYTTIVTISKMYEWNQYGGTAMPRKRVPSRHNLLLYWFCVFLPLQIPDRQPFPALCPARQPLGRPCSMLSRFLGTLPGQIRIIALLPQKRYGRGRYSVVARGSISSLNYNG